MAFNPSRTSSAIFGRDGEQERLRSALTSALGGHGGLVLISGEAGIGKTTIVRDLAESATRRGALVLTGHCYDLSTTPPYGPWLEIIRENPRIEGLPSLSQIIGGDGDINESSPERGDDLFNWGLELFSRISSERPLVIILEDIHWADRASLDFLRFLGRSSSNLSILVAATYRADEIRPGHPLYILLPSIIRESEPERIDLLPLDDVALSDWIHRTYSMSLSEERRLVDYLQRQAEGNPFFASEVFRELEATGILHRVDGRWQLSPIEDVGVPMLLRQVLETRIGRLSFESRETLGLASVIGQEVDIDLWRRLAALSDDEALTIVEQASLLALIDLSNDGHQLSFRHALIREALYEEILSPRRRLLHKQIADALLEADDPEPDTVAHHLQQAGDPRAAEWLIKAGDRAYYQAYSIRTALTRYKAALEALPEDAVEERGWLLVQLAAAIRFVDPETGIRYADEAERVALQRRNRRLRAVAVRLRSLNRGFAGESGAEDIMKSLALLDELRASEPPQYRDGRHKRTTDPLFARGEFAMWLAGRGRYREALETSSQLVGTLDPTDRSSGGYAAVAHWAAGVTHSALGRPAEAARALEQARSVFDARNQSFHSGEVLGYELHLVLIPYSLDDLAHRKSMETKLIQYGSKELVHVIDDPPDIYLAAMYLQNGNWQRLGLFERDARNRPRSPVFLFMAHAVIAEYLRCTGQDERALEFVSDGVPGGPGTDPQDSSFFFARALELQRTATAIAMDRGNLEEARSWIDAHGRWLDWSERIHGRAEQATQESRLSLLLGDAERASVLADEAVAHARAPRQPLALLQAHRARGETLGALGRYKQADHSLQRSIELAEACDTPYERALTQIARAQMHATAREVDKACNELSRARPVLDRLGAKPALTRLESVRAQLPTSARLSPTDTAGLSDREIEVLQLVAEGLTDRQIGDRLYISPRTAGQHLRSIFNKLNVNSRTAAAIRGRELGLI